MVATPKFPRMWGRSRFVVALFPVRVAFRAMILGRHLLHRSMCIAGCGSDRLRFLRRNAALRRRVVVPRLIELDVLRVGTALRMIHRLPGLAGDPLLLAAVALRFVFGHARFQCNAPTSRAPAATPPPPALPRARGSGRTSPRSGTNGWARRARACRP